MLEIRVKIRKGRKLMGMLDHEFCEGDRRCYDCRRIDEECGDRKVTIHDNPKDLLQKKECCGSGHCGSGCGQGPAKEGSAQNASGAGLLQEKSEICFLSVVIETSAGNGYYVDLNHEKQDDIFKTIASHIMNGDGVINETFCLQDALVKVWGQKWLSSEDGYDDFRYHYLNLLRADISPYRGRKK